MKHRPAQLKAVDAAAAAVAAEASENPMHDPALHSYTATSGTPGFLAKGEDINERDRDGHLQRSRGVDSLSPLRSLYLAWPQSLLTPTQFLQHIGAQRCDTRRGKA